MPRPFQGMLSISPSLPPSFPPPLGDLFFSYITCLKMALFKSIQHTLRSEKGHVAPLRARRPPPLTTVFGFCDFKAEPPQLICAPRVRLRPAGVGDSGTVGPQARGQGLGLSEEKTVGVCSGRRGPLKSPGDARAPRSWEEICSGPKSAMDQEDPASRHPALCWGWRLARARLS